MDIRSLEYAAQVVFAICKSHPEICPHDYDWQWSQSKEDGTKENHYKCKLCGQEKITVE